MTIMPLKVGAAVMPLMLVTFHVSVVTGPPDKVMLTVTVPDVYVAGDVLVSSAIDQSMVPVSV
jgi:hypothetical protein